MTRARRNRHFGSRQVERGLQLERDHIETIMRVLVGDAEAEAEARRRAQADTQGKDVSAAGAEEE